jgi:hypothetical protein
MQVRDFSRSIDGVPAVHGVAQVQDFLKYRTEWLIRRYENDLAFQEDRPFSESIIHGNLLLNAGIQLAEDLLIGAGGNAFNNANSSIGVGDGGPTALTGTLAFTNGSAAVTGTSTLFTTELAVGDYLVGPDGLIYTVSVITNNTSLTLSANYAGATVSGQTVNKVLRELATQTGLQAGSNKLYRNMSASYPSRSSNTVTWRAVFASSDANFAWREFAINNGNAGAGTNLNRKVSYQGVKASGQTWTTDATLTLS